MDTSAVATIEGLPEPVHKGKVRELFSVDRGQAGNYGGGDQLVMYPAGADQLIMVAMDRISAFDVVLPTPIPEKGKILTALSLWWFERLKGLVKNHFISDDPADYPEQFREIAELRGRSMLIRKLDMIMIECVARAYLSGTATIQYRRNGRVCGVQLPPDLREADRLPEPAFTPTTKGGATGHDEPMTYSDVVAEVGQERAADLKKLTLAILERGREICEPQGIIVADTKVEFGVDSEGELTLADEVLTPDASRFWPADSWTPGQPQPSFDKQPLRDWLEAQGWDKQPPGPELPDEIVDATRQRYVTAYERITGRRWT